jgi:hypothetical protein
MSKLDYDFANAELDLTFTSDILNALSSSLLDHCSLPLAGAHGPTRPCAFKFENFWSKMSSFQQVVNEAWFEHVPHA